MKIRKIAVIASLVFLVASVTAYSQDQRTMETKVADLLARMPANGNELTHKLMADLLQQGEPAIRMICERVVPAGTGDDTPARFAIESLSRFLSARGREKDKLAWEKTCIDYVKSKENAGVKDFFMKQLQLIGGEASAEAVKEYLNDKEVCEPAVAVILASGGKNTESILAGSLKNKELPCAAAVMNALADLNSGIAVNQYIEWTKVLDVNLRASALNALAHSNSPVALDFLLAEAAAVAYRWEHTGATAALLTYADLAGARGDVKTVDKITSLIIKKSKEDATVQNKCAALGIYAKYHGIDAMPLILRAARDPNDKYRTAAMRYSLDIPDSEVVNSWTAFYRKASTAAKAEIIAMLGERGDKLAEPLVNSALSAENNEVRKEAAEALAKISGGEAINSLINYMIMYPWPDDQKAAKEALMTVMKAEDTRFLAPVLKDGRTAARKTSIELLAWKKDSRYFNDVFALANSADDTVKNAAIKALSYLAGADKLEQLVDMLLKETGKEQITDLQDAVAAAALAIPDPERRSEMLIRKIKETTSAEDKMKLIPVLAKTGGREALSVVLGEFNNGNSDMREVSFRTLTGWRDYSASSALYEIATSGNKTFEAQAVDGYVRQVRSAVLPDAQKLLLLRKIMPFATRKSAILSEIARLKTYQSLFFAATFLDNSETSAAAAMAVMNIALPSSGDSHGMYGTIVRDILTKASSKLSGSEADYNREMINKYLASMPAGEGFKPMFNGKDLTGWKGLVENPLVRAKMKPAELAKRQAEADKKVAENWSVKDGAIWFSGKGNNLCSVEQYGDFEMLVDWKISKEGDSGIYLRGTPQVQIWDTSRTSVGAQVGSGGLYNNKVHPSKPLKVADNPVGDWNTFRIIMIGEKVSVWLNGELVVDNVTMENFWNREIPIFPKEQIELQAHGNELAFRDIYIREISDSNFNLTPEEKEAGFVSLFNGNNLDNWMGNKESYVVENGIIAVKPGSGSGGNLYTSEEYGDFIFRFEFKLTPAANNGLGIRTPLQGDAAYGGMELQILDDTAPVYANLQPYQYHGSVYGVIPARKGFQKPVGEWNYQEVEVRGTKIKITLNGTVIVDGDIAGPRDTGTMDKREHPGLKNTKGHIGFLGHGSELWFRNIRIKDLGK
jgi:HEAT repeat protein